MHGLCARSENDFVTSLFSSSILDGFSIVAGDDVSYCYLALCSLGIALICYFFYLLLLQFIFDFVHSR